MRLPGPSASRARGRSFRRVTGLLKCSLCGTELRIEDSTCPKCRPQEISVEVGASGHALVESKPATVVTDGVDPVTGDRKFSVGTPEVRSESSRSAGGEVSLWIAGPTRSGKEGEPRVARTLCERLRNQGRHAVRVKRTEEQRRLDDDHGIDEVIEVGGKRINVQIVRAPLDSGLWRGASRGRTNLKADIPLTARLLREAIIHKYETTSSHDRVGLVLAVDVNFPAVLSDDPVLTEYLSEFGDPHLKLGFASIWIVGPTAKTCSRLGTGEP
mgnify:CR=1 FL=1